ncbi:c-type cytochrome [Nisaea sp.]|uniref:c-type cytochrome n=1 Tax=Nisaea sp. TaxID=2024842 RepID=UPI003B52A2A5
MRTILPAAIAFLIFATSSQAQEVREPDLKGPEVFGKIAYEKFCAGCHGLNGVGTDKGPPFLHRVYAPGHHSDESFYLAALRGARAHHWRFGDMKPVEGVTEKQIEMIVKYVRALQRANGIR